ncbi:MAG TPA: hypothetical protein VK835_03490 [Bacteroidia bacterium]|jgi:hypothetical protein|nr:hypothetical protein [Bacteroidia bacterium]
MKKVILSLVVVAALSTSCKKDYTCTCTATGGYSVSATIHDTKSKATTACTAGNNSASGITCAIK